MKPRERKCGNCQLCCTLLPVKSLGKGSGQHCRYETNGAGCSVYRRLERVSPECKLWSCRWLVDPAVAAFPIGRPDRVHYVLDMVPDAVVGENNDTGKAEVRLQALQVWVDPEYPDAHRDPGLRAYLAELGEKHHVVAIIRIACEGGEDFLLVPPALNDGEWLERRTGNRRVDRAELARVWAEVENSG